MEAVADVVIYEVTAFNETKSALKSMIVSTLSFKNL